MNKRALLLGLTAALPVLAGGDGFTIALNTGMMKANHSPMVASSYSVSSATLNSYTNVFAEYGTHTPIGLSLGLKHGDNSFTLDYFGSSKKEATPFSYTVSGTSSGYGISGYDTGNTDTKLEASIVDLKWKHFIGAGNHGTFNTTLGLRVAEFKGRLSQRSYQLATPTNWGEASYDQKTSTYGLLAGFGYSYPLSESFSVGMDLTFAFLQGDDEANWDRNYYSWTVPQHWDGKAKNQTYSQQDFSAHVDWKIVRGIELSLGYRYQNYGKVNKEIAYPMWGSYEINGGWGLSGVQLGVAFTF